MGWGVFRGRLLFPAMLGVASFLCGCAAMSESECLTADWYAVGERDGQEGRPLAHLAQYHDACSQYGVYPDEDAYSEGRERGLMVYCTEDGGYQEGRVGLGYRGVCPAILEPNFLEGYNVGIAVRETIESVHRVDYGIQATREEIKDLRQEIGESESPGDEDTSNNGDRPPTDRSKDNLNEMYRKLGRLEAELERLEDEKVNAIVAYRRAVDIARSMGFYERYEY